MSSSGTNRLRGRQRDDIDPPRLGDCERRPTENAPHAAPGVVCAWLVRTLLIIAVVTIGFSFATTAAYGDSLLDEVGEKAGDAVHKVEKTVERATGSAHVKSKKAPARKLARHSASKRAERPRVHRTSSSPKASRTERVFRQTKRSGHRAHRQLRKPVRHVGHRVERTARSTKSAKLLHRAARPHRPASKPRRAVSAVVDEQLSDPVTQPVAEVLSPSLPIPRMR